MIVAYCDLFVFLARTRPTPIWGWSELLGDTQARPEMKSK